MDEISADIMDNDEGCFISRAQCPKYLVRSYPHPHSNFSTKWPTDFQWGSCRTLSRANSRQISGWALNHSHSVLLVCIEHLPCMSLMTLGSGMIMAWTERTFSHISVYWWLLKQPAISNSLPGPCFHIHSQNDTCTLPLHWSLEIFSELWWVLGRHQHSLESAWTEEKNFSSVKIVFPVIFSKS